MAQATSGETAWAETHHMPVCNFPYWTGPDYVSYFVYKGTMKENFDKP